MQQLTTLDYRILPKFGTHTALVLWTQGSAPPNLPGSRRPGGWDSLLWEDRMPHEPDPSRIAVCGQRFHRKGMDLLITSESHAVVGGHP